LRAERALSDTPVEMAFDVDRQYRVPSSRKWFFELGGPRVLQRYRSAPLAIAES